jgi:3-hydroxyisobutyrate dehydrogenase
MTRVGFIGLGTMGTHMAAHLLDAGHALTVHDLAPAAAAAHRDRGADWADTPAEVAAASDVVFTSLPGPPQVEAVALGPGGLVEGARQGMTYVDLTTNSPTTVQRVAEVLAGRGVPMLDAPVSGGPDGARSGRLALWVGGDPATFERVLPVLESFSDAVHFIGPLGSGSVAKLVHNLSGYIIQTGLAETFTLGVRAGLDPEVLWKAVRMGAIGRRRTFDTLARNYLPGTFDPPGFALRLAHKDVSLACELGRELGVPMRLANLTLQELTEAVGRGWSGRDSRVAMLLQEERAGVEVRVTPDRIAEVLDGE